MTARVGETDEHLQSTQDFENKTSGTWPGGEGKKIVGGKHNIQIWEK